MCGGCSSPTFADDRKTRAAMCQVCRHADRRDGWAVICRIDGADLYQSIKRADNQCPKGLWPDWLGMIYWYKIRWRGVPKPVRLRLPRAVRADLPGCGCIDKLKSLTERARSWLTAYRGRTRRRTSSRRLASITAAT